jgi:hypothetical protein
MSEQVKYEQLHPDFRLGKAPAKGSPKLLSLNNYLTTTAAPPATYDFWAKRAPFPITDLGNNQYGDCTIASQVLLSERMERLEQRRTISVPKQNIVNVYFAMTQRLYGGGDTGAFEIDALSNWRKPDLTFRDDNNRPYTIDAYTAIDFRDVNAIKNALVLSGAHGIKVCFNLPYAWASTGQGGTGMIWDIPAGQQPTGNYLPGSWGGHSMTAIAKYDQDWLYLPSSWQLPDGKISWRAFAIYCDEAYLVIDSVNSWKKRLAGANLNVNLDLDALKGDVNSVSSQKIK